MDDNVSDIPGVIPYIDQAGNIVIPFNADKKYQYWNGGQPLAMTLQELNVPEQIWRQYVKKPYPGDESQRHCSAAGSPYGTL